MRFLHALLRHRLVVLLVTALLLGLGALAFHRLPIDAFPDVTSNQVMVLTPAPGLTAIDVEQGVSRPIEQVMRGLPQVELVRSLSRAGLSQVVVVFQDGTDTYFARQLVFERLSLARAALPEGFEPELGPISTGLGEILQYTVEGEKWSAADLRTLQDTIIAPYLKPVSGVNEVNSFGGEVKQYQILVSPERLEQYRLTLEQVVEAVERSNSNVGAGILVRGWEQLYLRGVGMLGSLGDLEQVVLDVRGTTPLLLRDVADVVIGAEPKQGAVTRDGQGEVVAGMIIMLKGENAKEVVSRAKQALSRLEGTLPEGVRLNIFYDRTSLVEACIETVVRALIEGGLWVVLVLFLFVAELRTALLVVLSLPITFLVTFGVMHLAGQSANLMSLGGLAFSVGMVVDATIVVVENVRRHLVDRPQLSSRARVVARAVEEVARPVTFSVMIVAVILLPLFTMHGIEGKMFAPLAAAMAIALLVSLVVAFTIIPVVSYLWLPTGKERTFRMIGALFSGYQRLLRGALQRPKLTLGLSGALLFGGLVPLPFLGTEFMPPLDEGAIAINVVRLPNASLEGSIKVAQAIEQRLRKFKEVSTVLSKTGRAEISEDPMGPEQTDVLVMLKPESAFGGRRDKESLVEAMQEELAKIPGLRFSFSQPIALRVNELISGIKSDVALKVFGPDLAVLKGFADRAAAIMNQIDGARDVKVEQVTGMAELDVELDRQSLARHGLRVSDVNDTLSAAVGGKHATTLVEGERRVAVVVRLAGGQEYDVDELGGLLVATPRGERVQLAQLARLKVVEAPAQVSRENGMRRVVIEANVRGRDLGGFVAEVKTRLGGATRELPPGTTVEYGGQFENQERAMRTLGVVVPVTLLLIVLALMVALGSVKSAGLVLVNLPFALVGGLLALFAFSMPLSVSAAVAFIVLLGVAVQNGVVLMAVFGQLRRQGASARDAVVRGSELRFRPLLMTALTSFIGHIPMLVATGAGAELQRPLAVVVMGGLITSTWLTLVVLPVASLWLSGREPKGKLEGTNS